MSVQRFLTKCSEVEKSSSLFGTIGTLRNLRARDIMRTRRPWQTAQLRYNQKQLADLNAQIQRLPVFDPTPGQLMERLKLQRQFDQARQETDRILARQGVPRSNPPAPAPDPAPAPLNTTLTPSAPPAAPTAPKSPGLLESAQAFARENPLATGLGLGGAGVYALSNWDRGPRNGRSVNIIN